MIILGIIVINFIVKNNMDNQKDISLENIQLSVPGKILLENTNLKISYGIKYGLVGNNGVGKSTLLKYIYKRKFNIPKNIDIFYVEQEHNLDEEKSILMIILESNRKKMKMQKKYEELKKIIEDNDDVEDEILDNYEKLLLELNSYDVDKDEPTVRKILFGLGFEQEKHLWPFKKFSGGWKMRVLLARALYMKPILLLLDEPTNHLDLNAVIWLTNYLSNWKKTLVIVSHDKNFLNDVCEQMIHIQNKKLNYYKGNYDNFKKSFEQNQKYLEKEWEKVQKTIKEMRKKSIPKSQVDKFIKDNLYKEPSKKYKVNIYFEKVKLLKSPAVRLDSISFSYGLDDDSKSENIKHEKLYNNLNLDIDQNTRITIVGKNGIGKSTLFKIIMGEIKPTEGKIYIDNRVKIGYYSQHLTEILPLEKTPIEFIRSINKDLEEIMIRKQLGSLGLEGKLHLQKITNLSGGQKARVLLASLYAQNPHILLLDEPTNHLDLETIDELINAINEYNGGVLIISHNVDLIKKTNCLIYELAEGDLHQIELEEYYSKILQ